MHSGSRAFAALIILVSAGATGLAVVGIAGLGSLDDLGRFLQIYGTFAAAAAVYFSLHAARQAEADAQYAQEKAVRLEHRSQLVRLEAARLRGLINLAAAGEWPSQSDERAADLAAELYRRSVDVSREMVNVGAQSEAEELVEVAQRLAPLLGSRAAPAADPGWFE